MSKRKAPHSPPVDDWNDETIYGEDDPSSEEEDELEELSTAAVASDEPPQKKPKTETSATAQQAGPSKTSKTKQQIKQEKLQDFAAQNFNFDGYPFLSLHDERLRDGEELHMVFIDDWQHAKAAKADKSDKSEQAADGAVKKANKPAAKAKKMTAPVRKDENSLVSDQQARWRRVARHSKNELDYYVEKRLGLNPKVMRFLPDVWTTKDARIQTVLEREEYLHKIGHQMEVDKDEHDKWIKRVLSNNTDDRDSQDKDSNSREADSASDGGASDADQISNPPPAKSSRKKPNSYLNSEDKINTKNKKIAKTESNAEIRECFVREMQKLAGELAETFYDFTICGEDIRTLLGNNRSRLGDYTIALLQGTTYDDIAQAKENQGKVGWWTVKGSKKSCRKRGLSTEGTKIERFYRLMRYELTHLNHNNMTFTEMDIVSAVIQGVLFQFRKGIDDMRQEQDTHSSAADESGLLAKHKNSEDTKGGAEIDGVGAAGRNGDISTKQGLDGLFEANDSSNDDIENLFVDAEEEGDSEIDSGTSSAPGDDEDEGDDYWPELDWWLSIGYTEEEANAIKSQIRRRSHLVTPELSSKSPASESSSGSLQWEWKFWKDPLSGIERREPAPRDSDLAHQYQLQRAKSYAKLRRDNEKFGQVGSEQLAAGSLKQPRGHEVDG